VYTEADPEGLDLLDEAGAPQGKRAMVGDVRLPGAPVVPDQIDVPHPGRTNLGGGLSLLGWGLDHSEGQAGERLLLTLAWQVESQPGAEYLVQVWVTDATGQILDAGVRPPTIESHPTDDWQEGQAWRGQSMIRLPVEAQPGEARLSIQLVDTSGAGVGPVVDLAPVQILPTDRDFEPPVPQVLLGADFAGKITLVGANVDPAPIVPGSVLEVVLFWQAQTEMDVPYTVFVHLLGPDGRLVAGDDEQPVDGTRPTTGWVPGEYITDPHRLPLPLDLSPGEYTLEVGLYDAGEVGLPRLPVIGQEGQAETDKVVVGSIQVQ
jgi:hypothetical protein